METGHKSSRTRSPVITDLLFVLSLILCLLLGYLIGNIRPLHNRTEVSIAATPQQNGFVPICKREGRLENFNLTVIQHDKTAKLLKFSQGPGAAVSIEREYCDNITVIDGHTGQSLNINDVAPGWKVNITSNNFKLLQIEVITK